MICDSKQKQNQMEHGTRRATWAARSRFVSAGVKAFGACMFVCIFPWFHCIKWKTKVEIKRNFVKNQKNNSSQNPQAHRRRRARFSLCSRQVHLVRIRARHRESTYVLGFFHFLFLNWNVCVCVWKFSRHQKKNYFVIFVWCNLQKAPTRSNASHHATSYDPRIRVSFYAGFSI